MSSTSSTINLWRRRNRVGPAGLLGCSAGPVFKNGDNTRQKYRRRCRKCRGPGGGKIKRRSLFRKNTVNIKRRWGILTTCTTKCSKTANPPKKKKKFWKNMTSSASKSRTTQVPFYDKCRRTKISNNFRRKLPSDLNEYPISLIIPFKNKNIKICGITK